MNVYGFLTKANQIIDMTFMVLFTNLITLAALFSGASFS